MDSDFKKQYAPGGVESVSLRRPVRHLIQVMITTYRMIIPAVNANRL